MAATLMGEMQPPALEVSAPLDVAQTAVAGVPVDGNLAFDPSGYMSAKAGWAKTTKAKKARKNLILPPLMR
jgi:hypothetical protein